MGEYIDVIQPKLQDIIEGLANSVNQGDLRSRLVALSKLSGSYAKDLGYVKPKKERRPQ